MPYIAREEAPSSSDKRWISTRYGGYNPCIIARGQSVLPNCVGYAYGRFMEIMGTTSCKLPTSDAGQWFGYKYDGYERGSTPRLGAVICWSHAGYAGHVAIVEKINPDKSIVTSNSAWQGTLFYTQTLYPPHYTWNSAYVLQGFIYNPKAPESTDSTIAEFIKEAKSNIGKNTSALGLNSKATHSALYIRHCASKVGGILGTVLPRTFMPSSLVTLGVKGNYGSFIKGPVHGQTPTPNPGDIMLLRTSETRKYNTESACDQLNLVCEVRDKKAVTVTTTAQNNIISSDVSISSKFVCGYYRPDWSKIMNSADQMFGYVQLGEFYSSKNTAEDATIREVAYFKDDEPTLTKTDMRLSVVNYTTMLAAFLDNLLVPSVYSSNLGTDVIVDGITNKNAKVILQYLLNKGLNAAAACGIAGNIYYESNYRTDALGDYRNGSPTAFGICQWRFNRATGMKQMAGSNWSTNLTGQLDFLWYELTSEYTNMFNKFSVIANNANGARTVADLFVRDFERPQFPNEESTKRQQKAVELLDQLVIQMTSSSSVATQVSANTTPVSGKTIEVPSWIVQDGIQAIYTNYIYIQATIGWGYNQGKVYRLWEQKGKKHNRNIATIDGYYLIATKPVFGVAGDKVTVYLKNGTYFNAILADIKGNENGTTGAAIYGHDSAGKTNIIEWEGIGPATSAYLTTPLDLSGWSGQYVTKIVNGGSIL